MLDAVDRRRLRDREHVLVGIVDGLRRRGEILAIVDAADDAEAARAAVIASIGLDELQTRAVLDLQLRRLTRLDRDRVEAELRDVRARLRDA